MQQNNNLNNYAISIIVTLLGSVGLAFLLCFLHAWDPEGVSGWLLDLVYGSEIFAFISQLISGNGYLFQLVDKLTGDTTPLEKLAEWLKQSQQQHAASPKKSLYERLTDNVFIGLAIGITGAIALTITETVLHATAPFHALGSIGSHIIMLVGNLSLFGGLGNRTGRAVNHFKNLKKAFRSQGVNYTLAIATGFLIGIALTAVALGIFGATAITGGTAALPVVLFAATMIGNCASASGYIGRVFDAILGERTIFGAAKEDMNSTESTTLKPTLVEPVKKPGPRENILTAVGIGIGMIVGVSLILAGVATLPFFGFGVPKLIAGIMIVTCLVSSSGGAGNRIGYVLDRLFKKPVLDYNNSDAKPAPANTMTNPYNNPKFAPPAALNETAKQTPQLSNAVAAPIDQPAKTNDTHNSFFSSLFKLCLGNTPRIEPTIKQKKENDDSIAKAYCYSGARGLIL